MRLAKVKIYSWQNPQVFDCGSLNLKKGEKVIVETELAKEIGEVVETEINHKEETNPKPILSKPTASDLTSWQRYNKNKEEALRACRQAVKKYELPMKLVDAHFSFDNKVIFAFTSEQKVDFRNLVRDLTRHFQKQIRLQQIGSREEARQCGGYGTCGRELCCLKFAGNLESISTQMAKLQQLDHRGSFRLSGPCGRLMCCLAFEAKQYEKFYKNIPKVGQEIETPRGKGKISALLILEQQIEVELADKTKVKMSLGEIK